MDGIRYAGFWIRCVAALLDTLWILLLVVPLLTLVYGPGYWGNPSANLGVWDLVINYLLPAAAVILFWRYRSATPGKMLLHLTIRDAKTGQKPSAGQCVIRYLGYYLASIPLLLGIFWIAIDARKQGWHDKLAGTVVVREDKQPDQAAS